jgi:hypothetical protein
VNAILTGSPRWPNRNFEQRSVIFAKQSESPWI